MILTQTIFLSSMFWKKEKFTGNNLPYFFDKKGTYHRLVTEGEWNKMKEKLNLILDYLNLEFVPETEKMESAKLVERENIIMEDTKCTAKLYPSVIPHIIWQDGDPLDKPKKKKRGRPKKK